MKRILFLAILVGSSACGVKSQYTPVNVAPGEIVWRFDGGLEAVKGGEVIASAPGFTDLAGAVACVPAAREEAEDAAAATYAGWSLLSVGIAGTLGGFGVIIGGTVESDPDVMVGGAGLTLGAATVALIGALVQMAVLPNALDAVNIYNDEFASRGECSPPLASLADD